VKGPSRNRLPRDEGRRASLLARALRPMMACPAFHPVGRGLPGTTVSRPRRSNGAKICWNRSSSDKRPRWVTSPAPPNDRRPAPAVCRRARAHNAQFAHRVRMKIRKMRPVASELSAVCGWQAAFLSGRSQCRAAPAISGRALDMIVHQAVEQAAQQHVPYRKNQPVLKQAARSVPGPVDCGRRARS